MKSLIKITFVTLFLGLSTFSFAQNAKYKCMLQMSNYKGLEAYVVVSLINPNGQYEKTLYMMGPDKQWYNGFKQWDKFNKKKKEKLSGITGASVAAGDRSITTFSIDQSKMNKGYKLRFESAVEDGQYHVSDVEIPLTTAGITQKVDGKGYIRYVKLSKAQ
ncbi:DUF2271 domain-containing protein [Empedobacter brevis]|uniref:Tat pathway signal protein n=2 Tax=Empedobacter brevis TaxID=247 RepID=A0A511NDL1_9FLAO|nr:DUF2271 domain-containing protein [Empedobacter brevis]MDM1072416.1 DUF2271 domain-containing protein [Empedobacter brevis]QES92360.1 DUF2271 domain-containing protein [Empedobacter brevis]QHC84117.1 flagellin biosynthesis protein FlgD [Empedobacter brevis]GEM50903.1 Tat pathway signal protein [Empedobacter brevis NBRC 14943 = ATCC 43319]